MYSGTVITRPAEMTTKCTTRRVDSLLDVVIKQLDANPLSQARILLWDARDEQWEFASLFILGDNKPLGVSDLWVRLDSWHDAERIDLGQFTHWCDTPLPPMKSLD